MSQRNGKTTGNVEELTQKEKGAKTQRRKKRRVMPLKLRLAKGEGRRHRAMQYWRISEAGIDVFPGTAEFMHYQEETTLMKTPLLCGSWKNALVVLPFFFYSLSGAGGVIATRAISHQLSQSSQTPEAAGTQNPCSSNCEFLFYMLSLAANSLISSS